MNTINNKRTSILFTLEVEKDQKPFMNVLIHKNTAKISLFDKKLLVQVAFLTV